MNQNFRKLDLRERYMEATPHTLALDTSPGQKIVVRSVLSSMVRGRARASGQNFQTTTKQSESKVPQSYFLQG